MKWLTLLLLTCCAPIKEPEVITKTVVQEKIVKVTDEACENEAAKLRDDVEYYRKRWIETECICDCE